MHEPLKRSVMYSPATVKTHIHRYLKHIYHPTYSLCSSPTYPYITPVLCCAGHFAPTPLLRVCVGQSDGCFSMY